jgi:hypothetical protein
LVAQKTHFVQSQYPRRSPESKREVLLFGHGKNEGVFATNKKLSHNPILSTNKKLTPKPNLTNLCLKEKSSTHQILL